MSKRAAKPKINQDREHIVDAVAAYMHEHHRDVSIDKLLTHPLNALAMGVLVAARVGRITPAAAKKVLRHIEAMSADHAAAMYSAIEICRVALASRKRGELRKDRV